MKIIKKILKQGIVKVQVESLDDLWYLSHLIDDGDIVSSKTERKIKIGGEEDRKARVVKKYVFLSLQTEKVEFHKSTNILRVSGKVIEGPEDVPHGSYHTINVEDGTILDIKKQEWLGYQLSKLKEASEKIGLKVLIVCHDREDAVFGLLTRTGMQSLSNIKGNVAKKAIDENVKGDFYKEVAKIIEEYVKRFDPSNVVVASPGFWKEYLIPHLSSIKDKIVQATCSTIDDRGLNEVVRRPELKQVLEQDRTRKDEAFMEELMEAISKDSAAYGIKECEEKINIGAVKLLLVSDNFIVLTREKNQYKKLDFIMKNAEKMKGDVHIVSAEEPAKKLDALGGVAGLLRWQV